jgi:ubiquinone/menaquinone biosynthesis C-methylase UbiE
MPDVLDRGPGGYDSSPQESWLPDLRALKLAHKVASHPWVYDRIQSAVGVSQVYAKLAPHLLSAPDNALVPDIGGGTGSLKRYCSPRHRYVCLDIEWEKLQGFRGKFSEGDGIWGDATRLPIAHRSVDTAICMFVAHHLNDDLLPTMLSEVDRTLRPGGRVILVDPVMDPQRMAGRILWKLDRGSFPRTVSTLRRTMQQRFAIEHWDEFAVWHHYVLGIGRKHQ